MAAGTCEGAPFNPFVVAVPSSPLRARATRPYSGGAWRSTPANTTTRREIGGGTARLTNAGEQGVDPPEPLRAARWPAQLLGAACEACAELILILVACLERLSQGGNAGDVG